MAVAETMIATDGVLYAGVSAFRQISGKQQGAWWGKMRARFFSKSASEEQAKQNSVILTAPVIPDPELARGAIAASVSLGCAVVGVLLFTPAHYLCIPVLIYMASPAAEEAYADLVEERSISRAALEIVAVAFCLAQGAYLVGSLGFALYYKGRQWWQEKTTQKKLITWLLPKTISVRREGVEMEVVYSELQPGDIITISTSEIAPAAGVIVEGVAWMVQCTEQADSAPIIKRVGSHVQLADLVLVGHIQIRYNFS